jgi:ATP-dependent Zn protease
VRPRAQFGFADPRRIDGTLIGAIAVAGRCSPHLTVGQPFTGRTFFIAPGFSEATAAEIDDEIRRIVDGAHQRAKDILLERRDALTTVSEILLKRETIEREQFERCSKASPTRRSSTMGT